jgi:hypothetical protein
MLKEEMKTKRANPTIDYHCLVVMINNNTRSSRVGLMVVTTTTVVIACYAKVIVMHTFMDVDGGVDMHRTSKHPPSSSSLFTTFPSFLVYIQHLSTYVLRSC